MRHFLLATLLTLTAITPGIAAEPSPMVITEVAAYESSGHEWIEVYNRSTTAVDLTKWKFFEDNTNHGLTLFRGENMMLAPGTYAVIAQVAATTVTDYP
ncbi:MAG: lamin tail domain-containing protein, partial [Patescibacteria group bacterium]